MRFYETIYIVDPNLENLVLEKVMTEIGQELEKTGSKLINHRAWGKKRLAYQIDKQKYGTYILMQFEEGDQEKMVGFSTWMKLNNSVIRHMTVTLDSKPEVHVEETKKTDSAKPEEKEPEAHVEETKKTDSSKPEEKEPEAHVEETKKTDSSKPEEKEQNSGSEIASSDSSKNKKEDVVLKDKNEVNEKKDEKTDKVKLEGVE